MKLTKDEIMKLLNKERAISRNCCCKNKLTTIINTINKWDKKMNEPNIQEKKNEI